MSSRKNSLFILILIVASACQSHYKSNPLLGKIPYIASHHIEEINRLRIEMEKNTNPNKAVSYSIEMQEARDKAKKEMNSVLRRNGGALKIPFSQLDDQDKFKANELRIVDVDHERIRFEVHATALIDSPFQLFTYLCFIDEDNQRIEGWGVLMSEVDVRAGSEIVMGGAFKFPDILINAARAELRSQNDFIESMH